MRDFKRLEVWRRSNQLAFALHRGVDELAVRHRIRLGDQLARAATSIPANVAEGAGRQSVREFKRYLTIAIGSAAELEQHLMLARDLGMLDADAAVAYIEVRRMLHGLRTRVRY